MEEKKILKVLADQQEEKNNYNFTQWCDRREEVLFEWDSNMAQVVIGVRRSGKSILCHKVLLQHRVEYAYVNFDDDRLARLTIEDLDALLNCIYQLYGADIKYLFFDEIQDVEGWHLFVNRLLRLNFHIFLTGSNAKLLSGELATHLTGRYNEIRLYPFSFEETCKHKKIETAGLTTKAEAVQKSELNLYLQNGGLPEFTHIKNPLNRKNYVEGLIETIINKDIAKRFNIRNTEGLRRITHHLINNVCQGISYESLAETANISSTATAQKYVSYLTQAFLIQKIQKFSFKSKDRIRGEKAYVVDTGFISNRDNSLLGENLGWRLENAVFVELLRRHKSAAEDIYYYKPTTRSKEVDFVVCRQGLVKELVQVAYSISETKTYKRETEALIEASSTLNCNDLTLISFDESRTIETKGKTIKIVSATEWFLLSSVNQGDY